MISTVAYLIDEISQGSQYGDKEQSGRAEELRIQYIRSLCEAFPKPYHSAYYCRRNMDREGFRKASLEENALAAAAYLGLATIFHKLVGRNVKDVETYFGYPLDCATSRGNLNMTQTLLERLPGIKSDFTTLRLAARSGHTDIVRLLLSPRWYHDEDFQEERSPEYFRKALRPAIASGNQEVIDLISEQWMTLGKPKILSTTWPDELQDHLLMWGAYYGNVAVVRTAIRNGAYMQIQRNALLTWRSAMDAASVRGFRDVVDLLLANGWARKHRTLRRPLLLAIEHGWLEIAQMLINAGGGLAEIIKDTTESWLKAAHEGQVDMLNLLIRNGVDIMSKPAFVQEVYKHAKFQGYSSIMRILAEYGAEDISASEPTEWLSYWIR